MAVSTNCMSQSISCKYCIRSAVAMSKQILPLRTVCLKILLKCSIFSSSISPVTSKMKFVLSPLALSKVEEARKSDLQEKPKMRFTPLRSFVSITISTVPPQNLLTMCAGDFGLKMCIEFRNCSTSSEEKVVSVFSSNNFQRIFWYLTNSLTGTLPIGSWLSRIVTVSPVL